MKLERDLLGKGEREREREREIISGSYGRFHPVKGKN